jgi:hypothetical protein
MQEHNITPHHKNPREQIRAHKEQIRAQQEHSKKQKKR